MAGITVSLIWTVFLMVVASVSGEEDTVAWVVPKCCPLGQGMLEEGGDCMNISHEFEPEFWSQGPTPPADTGQVGLIIGDPCEFGKYRLEPDVESSDEFHILANGSLLLPFLQPGLLNHSDYCLESFVNKDNESVVLPLVCFPPPPPPLSFWEELILIIYPIGLLISVPFLAATFIIFMFIPELRDTHGKCLSCHVVCLAVAYIALAIVQLTGGHLSHSICVTLAFVIQFAFVACFFWLNTLCIDTWWRLTSGICTSARQEFRRFLWYSVYAWTFPTVIVSISMVMDLTPTVPSAYLKPNFGLQSCWFNSDKAALPYFYGPVAILLCSNIVLFALSIRSLLNDLELRYRDETHVLRRSDQTCSTASRRVEMFKQCLILFIVMGLNWTLELLSWIIKGPPQIWLVTDTLNTLQGIIIFIVFVVRVRRVRNIAIEHLLPCIKRKRAAPHPLGRSRPIV